MVQDPPPKLTLLRVAAVVSGYLEDQDINEAMGEIIALLERGGVLWPKSVQERQTILSS